MGTEKLSEIANVSSAADSKYRSIKEELYALAEPAYAKFTAGLLRKPGEEEPGGSAAKVLGVRLPALHKLAKKLAREDWRGYLEALSEEAESFEERMLLGFLIACAKLQPGRGRESITLQEQFSLIRAFMPYIDNWSLCDSFCASLKFSREFPEETWEFLQPFLQSKQEYEIRFGLVMIINYFITDEYIDKLFPVFDGIDHEGYYVKMAVAWAVSICYVKYPEQTKAYLEENRLDDFTFHKALQKIVESRCVSDEVRAQMRQMKRKESYGRKNCDCEEN